MLFGECRNPFMIQTRSRRAAQIASPSPRGTTSAAALPHVVVVGAGFAGLEVARGLRDAPIRLTVIDQHNYNLFQPLLYQVATAALSPADVAVPIRSLIRHQNAHVLLDDVVGVDRTARTVSTAAGKTIGYDYLVLATGCVYDYLGHDDWPTLAPAPKTIDDALAIRRRVLLAFERADATCDETERNALLTFVLVGAGPTGVEMAGALAELARATLVRDFRRIDPTSARILLVEAGPRILTSFPEKLGAYAHRTLQELGVEIATATKIEKIEDESVVAGGERIAARTVIWCAGVKAGPVAAWLGARPARHGKVPVEADLTVPGQPEIFVLGDAAAVKGPDGKDLPGLAAVAQQEGRYAARAITARVNGQKYVAPFSYRDKGTLATIGRSSAVADLPYLKLTGIVAWLFWGLVHIFLLIGFRNRAVVLLNWLWAWLTYGRGARLITGQIEKSTEHCPGVGR
jgi:NADH:ubiquinone reductase (H+-translocating)